VATLIRPPSADVQDVTGATDYLYRLPRSAEAAGLARAAALLDRLGNPQDAVRTVHVAGTAGKSSVGAFASALLSAHGFKVGAHLSPHVRCILERFQIDGAALTAAEFVAAVNSVASVVDRAGDTPFGGPTFFEALNAIAFTAFDTAGLDYAVVETGLGGKLDATNTIRRRDKLAVLSRIGIDHTKVLGDTVADIAVHKAGILPRGGHAVALRHHQASVRSVVETTAHDRRCSLDVVDPRDVSCTVGRAGTVLHLDDTDLALGLQGQHQGANAALALRAVRRLAERDGWRLDPVMVRTALATTWLPGRFEQHTVDGRTLILDGAHNNLKLTALVSTLQTVHPGRRATFVLASKADKDIQAVLAAVSPVACTIIATQESGDATDPAASMPAAQIASLAERRGLRAIAIGHPAVAVDAALRTDAELIVLTGSFSHLGAADSIVNP